MTSQSNHFCYKQLSDEKIKMNFNKNPIEMEQFLSFLPTVKLEYDEDSMGWTTRIGFDNLVIRGGWVGKVEYLNYILYKVKLQSLYNNYVNPFFLFDLMTEEGKEFFHDYYKHDIDALIAKASARIQYLDNELTVAKSDEIKLIQYYKR